MQTTERPTVAPVQRRSRRPAPWPVEFYRSSVGKKWVMAITGIMLMGFVFVHMVGNLKMFLGAEEFNHYAEFLRELLVPILPRTVFLWILRIGLIGAFVFHIHAAYSLTLVNHRAQSQNRLVQKREWQAANLASRSMRYTGVTVLLFLVWHLADLTWGWVNPDYVRGDVYRNVVASFEQPPVALLYIVANFALGVHLWWGAWAMFQSLGLNNPRWNSWRRYFAIGFAVVVAGINISFPLAVMTGVVTADDNSDCTKQGDTIVTCENYAGEVEDGS
jgi:succinate dehydrogenase / fumarate reductase cytochrome b subunit